MSRDSRSRTLILPRHELERIKENTELGSRELDELDRQRRFKDEQEEATLRAAQQLAATFEKQQEAEQAAILERAEKRQFRTFKAISTSRDRVREQTEQQLARERQMHFWERDGVKQLHSALQLAEVLREREAQAQLKKAIRMQERDDEQLVRARVLSQVEEARAKERERRLQIAQDKINLREILNKQVMYHEMQKKEEEAELSRERKEELDLYEKFCEEKEREKTNITSKRDKFVREFLEAVKNDKEYRQTLEEQDRIERQICNMYINFKDRTKHKLEASRRAALKEKIRNREIKSIGILIAEEQQKEKEKEWLKKVENECLERARKSSAIRAARTQEQRRCALELQEHQTRQADEQLAERKRVDEEAIEARYRHDRITKAWKEFQHQEKRAIQSHNRRSYAEQREMKRLENELEAAHDLALDAIIRKECVEEDRQFLEYAQQVLQEAEDAGRPNLPLRRTLESYKKKYGIERKLFVKASMRSQLDIGVNEMRDQK